MKLKQLRVLSGTEKSHYNIISFIKIVAMSWFYTQYVTTLRKHTPGSIFQIYSVVVFSEKRNNMYFMNIATMYSTSSHLALAKFHLHHQVFPTHTLACDRKLKDLTENLILNILKY